MKKNIVILGGGMTGLTAGYILVKKGFNVVLLEKNDYLGGLSATFSWKGNLLDYGPHNFHTHLPHVLKFVRDKLNVPMKRIPVKASKLFFMGKFVDYPLKISNALRNLPWGVSFKCFIAYILSRIMLKIKMDKDEDSFESWVKAHFGNYLYNLYFGPYVKKVWGIHGYDLDVVIAKKRIPEPSLFSLVVRTLTGIRFGRKHSEDPEAIESYYPPKGIGTISDRLVDNIKLNDGKIELNCQINSIVAAKGNNEKKYISYTSDGINKKIEWDYLINTIPINNFVPFISAPDIEKIQTDASLLSYRSIILLYLFLTVDKVFDDPWVYFNDRDNPELIFNRLYEVNNFSREMSNNNKSNICLEITCYKDDETWIKTDKDLYEICISYLEKNNLLKREYVKDIHVKRLEVAYPVFRKGYQTHLMKVVDYFVNLGNIFCIGRQGLFSYANMDHCIDMGLKMDYLFKNEKVIQKDFYDIYSNYLQ